MAAIDIGPGAVLATSSNTSGVTMVDLLNPANASGHLTSFEVYSSSATDCAGLIMATAYGSSTTYQSRDSTTIGAVTRGSKQTFTGKAVDVSIGDFLASYLPSGPSADETNGSTPGTYTKTGNQIGAGEVTGYSHYHYFLSYYATGITLSAPTVTTQAASSVTATTCTGNGNVTDNGGQTITERGVCYKSGAGETPTTADTCVHDHTDATGAFTMSVTGLSAGTQYSMRAYAINASGTSYGSVVTVKTLGTVTTQAASNLCWPGMTGNGNVTNTGVSALTAKGFCYKAGTSGDPTIADTVVSTTGSSTGAYTVTIGPLAASTGYRVRAYATNSEGTFYGDTVQETTPAAGEQGSGGAMSNVFGWVA
jgi:hypothetical protein